MADFRKLLAEDGAHLFDGAMGTMLYQKGVFINQCYDELNVKRPELVAEVHREYVEAGAEILETNTYGANRVKLSSFALQDRVKEINAAGARVARGAAGEEIVVLGALGPLGIRVEPWGPTSLDEARAYFREQAEGLAEGGVDGFIIETISDVSEAVQALLGCREVAPELPVVVQMTIQEDGRTIYGVEPERIARVLEDAGADVIGLNCSVGPALILDAIQKMAKATTRPLSAQPNAGLPREIEGRKMYMASPDYMAKYARRLIQAGVKFVGGCCGTTPEHIAAMAGQVRALSPRRQQVVLAKAREAEAKARPLPEMPVAERSRLAAKIERGAKVTSVEVLPPRGPDPEEILEHARTLKAAGCDAINIPDGPRAMMRMGVIAASALVEREVGLETIPHYCCRDRNLLGMMSDLLGAAALGIRNLLIITGDPPKMGPYPDATAVFDIDSIGLTNLVKRMNQGLDPGGSVMGAPSAFYIGVGVNPSAVDLVYEIRRFEWKVDAGAQYAITQPIFDVEGFRRFLDRIAHVRIPIIAAVWPLVSYRNAEFLNNEIPGIVVPAPILERMAKASEASKEAGMQEGLAIAREMVERIQDDVAGIQVSAPFGKVGFALEVFRALRGFGEDARLATR